MAKEGFNYSFRLYLEGISVPFHSAAISCTPNGVEANISIFSNKEVLDLKPKTAVQIVFRDFVSTTQKAGWHLVLDGFFSSYYKTDDTSAGKIIGITCRDFRMDIRRSPAALAYQDKGAAGLGIRTHYNVAGIFQQYVVRGVTPAGRGREIRTYGNSGIDDIGEMLRYIAGTAYGRPMRRQANGEYYYSNQFGTCFKPQNERADGRLFLDSFVRGIWLEATGGTSVNSFLNKRIRVDKRMFIPSNQAGYNFWNSMNAGLQGAGYMLGNAKFTSVEAAIMRLAGLFSCHVYSCSTPSLISVSDDTPGVDNIIAKGVRDFLINRHSAEFGAKFILNETMLLPPFEFTSPPNCNLIFPSMCSHITWQYDTDVDVTRALFTQVEVLASPGSHGISAKSIQVPNALFNIMRTEGGRCDVHGRTKPPLTYEERYKGVNVHYGSVSTKLAMDDAVRSCLSSTVNPAKLNKINADIATLKESWRRVLGDIDITAGIDAVIYAAGAGVTPEYGFNPMVSAPLGTFTTGEIANIQTQYKKKMEERTKALQEKGNLQSQNTDNALNHHAILKFLNLKYSGRVVVVDGPFNPYIMCGFPGAVLSDDMNYGKESMKTILGMVQQVKHSIIINPDGADASTSVVMNNARFIDEPTDTDKYGYPLYMKATNVDAAKLDPDTLEFLNKNYCVPDAEAPVKINLESAAYDLSQRKEDTGEYVYAKDLLSLTAKQRAGGVFNTIYLDEMYSANRVAKFYSEAFKHRSQHFMIGNAVDSLNNNFIFMYDTIHEAVDTLKKRRPDAFHDYRSAIEFVMRDVCSADAFFQGILGLSIRDVTNAGDVIYKNTKVHFRPWQIYDEYFGVTTEDWESPDNKVGLLKSNKGGLMTGPGQMSSILEGSPVTAFIKERQDAVRVYLKSFQKYSQGMGLQNAIR